MFKYLVSDGNREKGVALVNANGFLAGWIQGGNLDEDKAYKRRHKDTSGRVLKANHIYGRQIGDTLSEGKAGARES